MTHRCTRCGEVKALDEFYKDKRRKGAPTPNCISCHRAIRIKNKDARRKRTLMREYGISDSAFQKMLKKQEGACAICFETFTSTPHVDHNHATNVVRALLCQGCNTGLGQFRESPERLASAIHYLKEHDDETR